MNSTTQVKNIRKKQQYRCIFNDCPWKIYCAVLPDGQTMQCKSEDFMTEVKRCHKVDISYYSGWHGYHLTLEKILGSYEDGYKMILALCPEIFDENPRNIAYYKTDDNGKLKSLCIVYLNYPVDLI